MHKMHLQNQKFSGGGEQSVPEGNSPFPLPENFM